jgi:fumarate hydratase subunit alpha
MSGLRVLTEDEISEAVTSLVGKASVDLPPDVEDSLRRAAETESQPKARYALGMILENTRIAREEGRPLCQDTGFFHLFISLGAAAALPSGFQDAANRGIKAATERFYLRSSLVDEPLSSRHNRGDNSPVLIHVEASGDAATDLTILVKGGGSENAARLNMLLPGGGSSGLKKAVLAAVLEKAAQACPPIVCSIGIGLDASGCLELALKGLLRPLGRRSNLLHLAELEEEVLSEINATGIGASGLGGDVTALDVHIEEAPTHIACLPVGIVLCCHSLRRATLEVPDGG